MHTKFWSEHLKRKDHTEDVGVGEKKILRWMLAIKGKKVWIGCIWLRIGTGGGSL
jgi:hypothetical protein